MFENNKIFILGLARSGYQAAKFLIAKGNEVVLNDSKKEEELDSLQIEELRDLGVELIFGSHPLDILDDSYDYLIKNPGVPIDHILVQKAKKLGIEVINEVEMAYRLLPDTVKLVAISGTNGKTTTTTLVYEILKKEYGDKVHLAGNIGVPLCGILDEVNDSDIIVMEISCQQLENLSKFKPNIAVLTNLSPAHIDFFKTYDNYKKVKAKLFLNQDTNDIAILNILNDDIMSITKDIRATTKYFSSKGEINGCYLKDDKIYYYLDEVMSVSDIFIAGKHNVENVMAAIMVVKELDVSNDTIVDVVKNFKGVEHRLEYVDTVNGRLFYNDTEATNIKCTQIALSSFDKPIILILGGLDRGQNFNDLTPYIDKVKCIIGIGEVRNRILEYGDSINVPTYCYEYLAEGFKKSYELSSVGDVILLSPASASWDQYKECEIRGAEFKRKVSELKEYEKNKKS